MALIELFDVPVDADEAFLADWRRERPGATLYRAVRDDVPIRFVSVAPGRPYEVVHEDGAVDAPGGVTVIDVFDDDRGALDRDAVAAQQGYLGTRIYRATGPADHRFVSLARWSSPLMVARARRRGLDAAGTLYQRLTR